MIVVSDTSPINYLLLIEEIGLLHKLFQKVLIPEAVFAELNHQFAPEPVRDWLKKIPAWIEIHPVPNPEAIASLDRREQQAITLAHRVGADLLLIDEHKARREALARGLIVAGTLNVLETAAQQGLVDLTSSLQRLMETNFRAAPSLLEAILERHSRGERRD